MPCPASHSLSGARAGHSPPGPSATRSFKRALSKESEIFLQVLKQIPVALAQEAEGDSYVLGDYCVPGASPGDAAFVAAVWSEGDHPSLEEGPRHGGVTELSRGSRPVSQASPRSSSEAVPL